MTEVTGEIILGLRQFGISKENKTSPIVKMGLIMDSRGIPISMCIHPGNTNEQLTAVPLEKEVIKMTGNKKFYIVRMQDLDPTISVNSMIWVVEPILLHSQ